jgi:hypothetical protein
MKMVTVLLMLVKSTTVWSLVKMTGELNTVQILKISTVLVHSPLSIVMVLGLVKISIISLLKLCNNSIKMVMDKSILVITSTQNTWLT